MTTESNNMDLEDLNSQLEALKSQLAEVKGFFEPLNSSEAEIFNEEQAIKQAFNEQMNKIRERKSAIAEKKYEIQKEG